MMLHAVFIHALKSPPKVIASKFFTHCFIMSMFCSRFSRSSLHKHSCCRQNLPDIGPLRIAAHPAFSIKLFPASHIYNEEY